MKYLSEGKLTILGAAGAIGSNMVQSALTMGLTPRICMYDPFGKGLQGAAEEMFHCSFPNAKVSWTTDIGEALDGAKFVVTSGGAPRKEGMTREDLLKGNAEIAAQLGRDIRAHCTDLRLAVIVFNPADITGLVALVHSGLPPSRVATLAALDSTRLQTALSQHFQVPQYKITGCRTYGGHGEMMAVFSNTVQVSGKPLTKLIGTTKLSVDEWDQIKARVRQGGKMIIQLRGRSSFQSPAHQSMLMIKAAMDGEGYPWPCGVYVNAPKKGYEKIMMAMETKITRRGISWTQPKGTEEEMNALQASYQHLAKLRDEVIDMSILPPLKDWGKVNSNL